VDKEGRKLYSGTNVNAPNQKVVTVDETEPGPQHWQDFTPETQNVLKPN